MKCFERLILRHIKNLLPPTLDPLQFAYQASRSSGDTITTTFHLALTHLDKKVTYVRMLFIDFSSAFNTIIPQHLTRKLSLLGLNTSLCNWILDFLMGRPQTVWIGSNTSSTSTLSCVLSQLLLTLLTHDCTALHHWNHIIKFVIIQSLYKFVCTTLAVTCSIWYCCCSMLFIVHTEAFWETLFHCTVYCVYGWNDNKPS